MFSEQKCCLLDFIFALKFFTDDHLNLLYVGFDSDLNLWATSKTKSHKRKKLRKLADRPKARAPPQRTRLLKKQGSAVTR